MTHSQTRNRNPKPRVGLAGLDVYRVALAYYRLLVEALRGKARTHVTAQATKAAESVVLNPAQPGREPKARAREARGHIAEAHPALGADRARRFRIAADEASEGGAALDLLEVRGTLTGPTLQTLRALLDRQRAMLWRLSHPR